MKLSVSLIGSCEKRYHMWYDSSFCIAFVADKNDNLGGAAARVVIEAKT